MAVIKIRLKLSLVGRFDVQATPRFFSLTPKGLIMPDTEVAVDLSSALSAALSDIQDRQWYDCKNWYNPATRQWFSYRVYQNPRILVMWPRDTVYGKAYATAVTIENSLTESVRELFTDTFNERYIEVSEEDDE